MRLERASKCLINLMSQDWEIMLLRNIDGFPLDLVNYESIIAGLA